MRHRDARSTVIEPHDGAYVGQHQAAHPTTTQYIVGQTVAALVPGTAYAISGWVNIPPTTDSFSFQLSVTWRDVNKAGFLPAE